MSIATSVITFSDTAAADEIRFDLDQLDYPVQNPDNFGVWLAETGRNLSGADLFAAWYQYLSGCDEDGSLCATLKVRLSDISLDYSLRASYGTIGGQVYRSATRTDYLEFSLSESESFDFGEILSASWNGPVFDSNNSPVASPGVVLSGGTATVNQPLVGVLECQVYEEWYEHELVVSPRTPTPAQLQDDEAIVEELYASTCWLFCNQAIDRHELQMPDNLGTCSGGYGGSGMTAPDDEPAAGKVTVHIGEFRNYCTHDLITSKVSVWIDGKLVTTPSIELEPGDYPIRIIADGFTPSDEDDLTENDVLTVVGATGG